MSDVETKPDPTTAAPEGAEKKPEETTPATTEAPKAEEGENKPAAEAPKTTDSVFSMFGGGPKKEKKEEEKEDDTEEPSGSSKAKKGEEVCVNLFSYFPLSLDLDCACLVGALNLLLMHHRKKLPNPLTFTSSPLSV